MIARNYRLPDKNGDGQTLQGLTVMKVAGEQHFGMNDSTRCNVLRARWMSFVERICWRWHRYCGWAAEIPA